MRILMLLSDVPTVPVLVPTRPVLLAHAIKSALATALATLVETIMVRYFIGCVYDSSRNENLKWATRSSVFTFRLLRIQFSTLRNFVNRKFAKGVLRFALCFATPRLNKFVRGGFIRK